MSSAVIDLEALLPEAKRYAQYRVTASAEAVRHLLSRQGGASERLIQETLRIGEEILRKICGAKHIELSVWTNREAPVIAAYYDTAGHKRPRTDSERRSNPAFYRDKRYDVIELLDAPRPVPVFKSRVSNENYSILSKAQRTQIKSTFLHCIDLTAPAALVVTADVENGLTADSVPIDLIHALGQSVKSDLSFRQLEPDLWSTRKPRVFIGSSSEGSHVARALRDQLQGVADCRVWSDGVFLLSKGTMESLEKELRAIDFAVLVATPDDRLIKRRKQTLSMRDNVLFELGFFMGALGRNRTFLLHGADMKLGLPSDLAGITTAKLSLTGRNRKNSLQTASNEIVKAIAAAESK